MKRMSQILTVAALGLAPVAVQAQALQEPNRADALAGAIAGSTEGLTAIERYLDAGGVPGASADRAVKLIRELQRSDLVADPAVIQKAADRISKAASRSFAAARIFKTRVTTTFELGEKRIGFDFGPPDAKVKDGFVKVTANSDLIKGPNPTAMRRPEGESLLRDGIRNIRKVKLPVENGTYRVMITTDDIGVPEATERPYGAGVKVNGERVLVSSQNPKAWVDQTYLAEPDGYYGEEGHKAADEVASRGNARGETTGGVMIVDAIVTNGELNLVFDLVEGRETYLTGVILEPATEQSVFAGSQTARQVLFTSTEDIVEATESVEVARQNLLSDTIVEASEDGNTQVLANNLDIGDPVVEPRNDVSPS
jgi:hypothetical protein